MTLKRQADLITDCIYDMHDNMIWHYEEANTATTPEAAETYIMIANLLRHYIDKYNLMDIVVKREV